MMILIIPGTLFLVFIFHMISAAGDSPDLLSLPPIEELQPTRPSAPTSVAESFKRPKRLLRAKPG